MPQTIEGQKNAVEEEQGAASAAESEDQPVINIEFLNCPITKTLMTEPVIASDGFTYEDAAIRGWIDQKLKNAQLVLSPMTGKPLEDFKLRPNITLKSIIKELNLPVSQEKSSIETRLTDLENVVTEIIAKVSETSVSIATTPVAHSNTASTSVSRTRVGFFVQQPIENNMQQASLQKDLCNACEEGSLVKAKIAIQKGADARLADPDDSDRLPFALAIFSLNEELVLFLSHKINPDISYISNCIAINLKKYKTQTPQWKSIEQLTLADLCSGYLNNEGRQVIFSDWLWGKTNCHFASWLKITINDNDDGELSALAATHQADSWSFGPSDTLVKSLVRLDGIRGTVWGALVNQYNFCVQLAQKMDEYIKLRLERVSTDQRELDCIL